MILELDTSLLETLNISINQLVFISLVLNENQNNHQDILKLLSRVKEEEIQELIQRNIIIKQYFNNGISYHLSDDVINALKKKQDSMFDEFYETFPVYVIRPDGTKGFLRANINKCRKEYNRIVGKSRAMHEHIMNCLRYELDDKMRTGKLGYMKTMWKWLTQHEWECYEEQLNIKEEDSYGTDII